MINYVVNRLLERKNIFADFVNGALFDGRQMLHPENLEMLSPKAGKLQVGRQQELKMLDSVEATAAFALLGQGKQVEKLLLDELDGKKELFREFNIELS